MESLRYALLAVTFALSACASIDTHRVPPADWPQLAVRIVTQELRQVQRTCRNDFWPQNQVNACAIADFAHRTCYIYTWTDDAAVLEHERAHCAGYDHPGESGMRDAWTNHQRARGARSASQ